MARTASDWITLQEAADIFAAANISITAGTLGRWARAGKLQSIRPGRRVFVRRAQIRAMLRPSRRSLRVTGLQPGLFEDLSR